MKSQTKALLASVMVLALALSSIGGVTYSWFSDTEIGNIEIGTGTASISAKAYANDVEMGGLTIEVNPGYTKTIKIEVTNTGTLPIDASAKVTCHKYQAFESDGRWSGSRLYFQDEDHIIETGDYKFQQDILFGSGQPFTESIWKTVEKNITTTSGKQFTSYADFYFYYDLGLRYIPPGESRIFEFTIDVSSNYRMNIIENPRIEVEAVQCASIIETMINGESELEIDDDLRSRSVIFIDNGVTVMISKEAISEVNEVSISYSTDGTGTRTVVLRYNDGARTPNSGTVTISFDDPDGNFLGSMTSPAKNTTFTFAAGSGGSS